MSKVYPREMTEPLVRGTLIHQALAQHYMRKVDPIYASPVDGIYHAAELGNKEVPSPLWDKWAVALEKMPAMYQAYWDRIEAHFEVLGVEHEYGIHFTDKGQRRLYTQRADLVVKDRRTGLIYIVDHKSAAHASPAVSQRYSLSGQFVGYRFFGQESYKEKFGGVILNVITVGKNGDFSFARPPLDAAPQAVMDFKATVLHAYRTRDRLREDIGPEEDTARQWPGVFQEGPPCLGPYEPCPHRDYCKRGVR